MSILQEGDGSTDLAYSIDKRVLINDIHRSSLEKGTCPFDFDICPLHFKAGFFNHADAVSHVAAQGDERPVSASAVLHKHLEIGAGRMLACKVSNTQLSMRPES